MLNLATGLLLLSQLPGGAEPAAGQVGSRIDDFELRDCRGGAWKFGDQAKHPVVVVLFLGPECPMVKLYAPRLGELAREFGPRGVAFVGINSNAQDVPATLLRFADEHEIKFPILKDEGGRIADRFAAERTPEVFVLDKERAIRYRGRVDDQHTRGMQRATIGRRDLALALEELLAGKAVSRPVTEAPGCRIGREPPGRSPGRVTYTREIAPVLQKHCITCHRPGEAAPFALTSYKAAAGWAATICEVIDEGRMPPWHADPRYGNFSNDPRLSAAQKKLFHDWFADGLAEGDPGDLPPTPVFPEGWGIKGPDQIVSIPQPFQVPAEGIIDYQYFEADPGFVKDQWIQAVEVRPTNRAVVHHCNIFLVPPGQTRAFLEGGKGAQLLVASAVGTPPMILPPGMAKRVPAGWRLMFVIHYTTVGRAQTDQTRVGLTFADPKQVKQEVGTRLLYDEALSIPPRVADHRVEKTLALDRDILVLALFPHMHLRGKAFRYEVNYPDGGSEILLDVPRFDFNWQNRYVLAEPKRVPAGSVIRCVAVYDNSPGNLANPDPSATVRAGTQSWEEMFNGYLEIVLADQDLTRSSWYRHPLVLVGLVLTVGIVLLWRRYRTRISHR